MFIDRIEEVAYLIKNGIYTKNGEVLSPNQCLTLAHYLLLSTKVNKGIVYIIGNGGSTGIASHFCTDLLKALEIPAMTLFDSNLLTCIGNDLGYENVFSHQLKTLINEKDLLVAISSSGRSQNIINAVDVAHSKGAKTITLSGFFEDNPLRQKGYLNMYVKSHDYGLVETAHFSLLHTVIDSWNFNSNSNSHLKLQEHDANKN
jgi:D-sedoheptulose 7-phosphate isomerase